MFFLGLQIPGNVDSRDVETYIYIKVPPALTSLWTNFVTKNNFLTLHQLVEVNCGSFFFFFSMNFFFGSCGFFYILQLIILSGTLLTSDEKVENAFNKSAKFFGNFNGGFNQ